MKLLVTGGAGYIGSVVAAQLVEDGHDVLVLDDLSTGHADAVPPGAQFVRGDLRSAAAPVLAAGIDAVLHFAARSLVGESVARPAFYWEHNLGCTLALLEAMRAAQVSSIVFSSTAAVYGEPESVPIKETAPPLPTSPYGASKLAVDTALAEYARMHGLGAVSLRYFNVAGAYRERGGGWLGERHDPETHLIPNVLATALGQGDAADGTAELSIYGDDYPTPDGTCIRDYIHVSDLARAHLLALAACAPGQHLLYNLGSGSGFSNREVLAACRDVTGRDIPARMAPRRPGDPAVLIASSDRIRADLGWRAARSLTDMVTDAWTFTQAMAGAPDEQRSGPQVTDPGARAGAASLFAERFDGLPRGSWRAPGRVNLIGEHTDYNEGFVLPFAIGAGVSAAAARQDDGLLALASRQAAGSEVTVALDSLAPGSVTGWAAYPAGVAWALREAGYAIDGASVAIDSDIPLGAGLSSSAALECAAALALTELHGITVPRPQLAAIAQRAENDFVGAPTGIMDQSAVLLCQAGHALLLDCRSGIGTAVPLDPAAAGLVLLVVDTRARHAHADGGYASRREACEAAAQALGVRSLRDITDSSELAGLDPLLRRRARHVVTENSRVLVTADLLRRGELGRTGPLLTASHASLRDDFEVSWPEADATVEAAIDAGACGARMTGGGFGGSVVALLPAQLDEQIRAAIAARFAREGWAGPAFTDAVPSAGARRVR